MTALKYNTINVTLSHPKQQKAISFVADGCKYFFNTRHILIELSGVERALYDYLCERMESRNNNITVDTVNTRQTDPLPPEQCDPLRTLFQKSIN
jgi:hypothetical protein